ncbi:MAG: hypothetical protein JXA64_03010 [Candidatus Fermentibacteraceae bacterium]|nr:hypothetical protein [Candidatus Fermentibacteraceae bacterium]MBN2608060.1 hypothetical protein [Candidatus Fermentibacteraceae bacterium]
MAVLTLTGRSSRRGKVLMLLSAVLLVLTSMLPAQVEMEEGEGATWEGGRLVLEEITIRGELRTPQALFMMLKATPNLRNVLLERSFIEDVIRPVYPGAFSDEVAFGAGREMIVLPAWIRYGSVAVLGSLSVSRYYQDDEEQGLVFGIAAGLDLVGNLILDLVGN